MVDAPSRSPDIEDGTLDDLLAAVVLKVVGRLGPRAARKASSDLRELLVRWAVAAPDDARDASVGFARRHGSALRRVPRGSVALDATLRTRAAELALRHDSIESHRFVVGSLVDALVRALMDASTEENEARASGLRSEVLALVQA